MAEIRKAARLLILLKPYRTVPHDKSKLPGKFAKNH